MIQAGSSSDDLTDTTNVPELTIGEVTSPTLPPADEAVSSTPENLDRVQIESLEDRAIIHFPYNSTRPEDNAAMDNYLSQLSEVLKASNASVQITGHTDMIGDGRGNRRLGLQRAKHIKNILVKKGVAADKVRCSTRGESSPVSSNDLPRGRYLNRRVEIQLNPQ